MPQATQAHKVFTGHLIAKQRGRGRVSAQREVLRMDRERRPFEMTLERRLVNLFRAYAREAADEYRATTQTIVADAMLPMRLERVLNPHYRSVILRFGGQSLDSLTATLNAITKQDEAVFEDIVRTYILTRGAEAIVNISGTIRGLTQRAVLQGVQAREGVEAIARRIFNTLGSGDIPRGRARVIARTETHNAALQGQLDVAQSLEIPGAMKVWVAIQGPRTRPNHLAMNRVEVGINEDFSVPGPNGLATMSRPGDPRGGASQVVNCRCTIIVRPPGLTVGA